MCEGLRQFTNIYLNGANGSEETFRREESFMRLINLLDWTFDRRGQLPCSIDLECFSLRRSAGIYFI